MERGLAAVVKTRPFGCGGIRIPKMVFVAVTSQDTPDHKFAVPCMFHWMSRKNVRGLSLE